MLYVPGHKILGCEPKLELRRSAEQPRPRAGRYRELKHLWVEFVVQTIRQMTTWQEGSIEHCSGRDVLENSDLIELERALGMVEHLYLKQRSSDGSFGKVCLVRQLTLTMVTD